MTCEKGRFRSHSKVEIQGCRATRSHRSTSSKLPPPLDRRGQRAARLWPLLNGGEAGQVGHRSHRAALPTPHFIKSSPLKHLLPPSGPCSSYLPAEPATPGRPKQSSAVPYSAFPSERAARLALLAHRPRGFSPPSLSLFLPLPPPSVRPSLIQPSTTICLSTTTNTQPQPQTSPTFSPASSFPSLRRQHHFVPWCSNNLQPGSKPCNSPQPAARVPATAWPQPSPARRSSRWILPTSAVGLRPRFQSLPLFPLLQQLLLPPPRFLPLRPRPSRPSIVRSR